MFKKQKYVFSMYVFDLKKAETCTILTFFNSRERIHLNSDETLHK